MEVLYKAIFHYKNIPEYMQKEVTKMFMKHRNEVVKIFSDHIDKINEKWTLTGKPWAFGDYVEDINPEYVDFIRSELKPYLDAFNKKMILKYCIGDVGDIEGYLPWLKGSNIYITLKEVKP